MANNENESGWINKNVELLNENADSLKKNEVGAFDSEENVLYNFQDYVVIGNIDDLGGEKVEGGQTGLENMEQDCGSEVNTTVKDQGLCELNVKRRSSADIELHNDEEQEQIKGEYTEMEGKECQESDTMKCEELGNPQEQIADRDHDERFVDRREEYMAVSDDEMTFKTGNSLPNIANDLKSEIKEEEKDFTNGIEENFSLEDREHNLMNSNDVETSLREIEAREKGDFKKDVEGEDSLEYNENNGMNSVNKERTVSSDDVTTQRQSQLFDISYTDSIKVVRKFIIPDNFAELLSNHGARRDSEVFFEDVYYDTSEFGLTTQDFWLRRRNDRWQLKAREDDALKGAAVTDDEDDIKTLVASMLNETTESHKDLTVFLSSIQMEEFARIRTHHQTYSLDRCLIDLDLTDFGYRVGTIELLARDPTDVAQSVSEIDTIANILGFVPYCQAKLPLVDF